jgi:hypothetical protein
MLRQYFFQSLITAILALHLVVFYYATQTGSFTVYYGGMLFFHTPVWLIFLIIGEMVIKFKFNYKLILLISAVFMVILYFPFDIISLKLIDKEGLFYLTDYIFCVSLFKTIRNRQQLKVIETE